jgi:hypothetical protein
VSRPELYVRISELKKESGILKLNYEKRDGERYKRYLRPGEGLIGSELMDVSLMKGQIERADWSEMLRGGSQILGIMLLGGCEIEGIRIEYRPDPLHHHKRNENMLREQMGYREEGEGQELEIDVVKRIEGRLASERCLFVTKGEINAKFVQKSPAFRGILVDRKNEVWLVYYIKDLKRTEWWLKVEREIRDLIEAQIHKGTKGLFIAERRGDDLELMRKRIKAGGDIRAALPANLFESYEVFGVWESEELQKLIGKFEPMRGKTTKPNETAKEKG